MNEALSGMLARYECKTLSDYENALKEIIQEIALLGLWRSKFFEHAAFYGGTALRILYGLDRFSEDLDFSLLQPKPRLDLTAYNRAIYDELSGFGLNAVVESKSKTHRTAIESAFIKAETKEALLHIEAPAALVSYLPNQKRLRIRLEVDTNPPPGFETESKPLLQPIPFFVRTYEPPDLFAGKIHAILCRGWANRVKGRDWYDFLWYVGRKIPVRLSHLRNRLIQTGHWREEVALEQSHLLRLLRDRIKEVDITSARNDVQPFLRNSRATEAWSKELFEGVLPQIQCM